MNKVMMAVLAGVILISTVARADAVDDSMVAAAVSQYCSSPNTRMIINAGVTFSFMLYTQSGAFIVGHEIGLAACQ